MLFTEVSAADQQQYEQDEESPPPRRLSPRSRDTFDRDLDDIASMIHLAREDAPHLRLAFYGQPGVGKTWLAASFPDVIIIDCHEAGSKFLPKKRFPNVHVIKTTELDQVEMMYWYLKGGNHNFKTVVIDTVTSLIEMAGKFMKPIGDDQPIVSTDPSMPSYRFWGQVNQNVGDLIWHFTSLPMNVIFLAHERERKDDDSVSIDPDEYAAPAIFPDLNPGTRKRLYGTVDIMGRLVIREVTVKARKEGDPPTKRLARVLFLRPSPTYQAKDRSDAFKTHVIEPTYEKLERQLKLVQEVS